MSPAPGVPLKETQKHVGAAVTVKELHGYVGFANIPNQVHRKAIKRGFEFTLMVVGKQNYFLHRFRD